MGCHRCTPPLPRYFPDSFGCPGIWFFLAVELPEGEHRWRHTRTGRRFDLLHGFRQEQRVGVDQDTTAFGVLSLDFPGRKAPRGRCWRWRTTQRIVLVKLKSLRFYHKLERGRNVAEMEKTLLSRKLPRL